MSLASPALAGGFFTTEPPGKSRKITELGIKKSGSKEPGQLTSQSLCSKVVKKIMFIRELRTIHNT